MEYGRVIKTNHEKKMWEMCYKVGMKNKWCNGVYARMDGDFIVEEDMLNKRSVCVIDNIENLREFFKHGNWCLGQAVIYKSLCFINQVNGGDEWLTMKLFRKHGVIDFESITFMPVCYEYKEIEDFHSYTNKGMEICSKKGFFVDLINCLLKAKAEPNKEGKLEVKY